jgi:hypothetical protein
MAQIGEFARMMANNEGPESEDTPTKAERKAQAKAERKMDKQKYRLGNLPGWYAITKED